MKRQSLLILLLVLLLVTLVSSAGGWASAMAAAASANYAIVSTAGQPAIGAGAAGPYSLCSGIWCGAQATFAQLFLPLVRR